MTQTHPQSDIRTVIVSGMSGSGKTTAVRALEDIGFFCIDNLPVVLLDQVLSLCERGVIEDVAVVVDVREINFLGEFERTLANLSELGYPVQTLFLTAEDDTLINRFKEVRRKHPLQGDGNIADGIVAEREVLRTVRKAATHVVDTTGKNVHQLRRRIQELFRNEAAAAMQVRLESFGFKHGVPREADYVFDVRFLPNPYFVSGLREGRGTDGEVADFIEKHPDTPELLKHLEGLLSFCLPRAKRDGRAHITVAIGCTGGHHRSVALVERLSERLQSEEWELQVLHRDIER